jgi:hypothetical protein
MNFSNYITLFIAHLLLTASCLGQNEKMDSLGKLLVTSKDSVRIDCINELSNQYILLEKKDSALFFARQAYEEAMKIQYIHGVAVSLSRQSQIAKHFDDDFIRSEALAKESLKWYEKTNNKDDIETLYGYLFYNAFAQSKFDEATFYAEKNYEIAQQKAGSKQLFEPLLPLFAIYRQSGNYEKSFLIIQQLHDFAVKENNKSLLSNSLYGIAQLYMLIQDYPTALTYFRQVFQIYNEDENFRKEMVASDIDIWLKMEFSEVFSLLHQFDSAWYYYKLFKPSKEVYNRVYWVSTGECHFLQGDYHHALQNFELGLAGHQKLNDRNEIMRTLLDIGKTYLALNNNSEALKHGREGLSIAVQTKAKQYARDGYQILSTVYDRLHQPDSANFYFRKYIAAKDEVLNDQARGKFAAYNYEKKIALVNKEKEIQQAKLEKESVLKKALITGIIILSLLGFIIVRHIIRGRKYETQRLKHELEIQKLESEKTKAELQQQATELAQMNPHFIFNSLNSINRFILQNNKAQASEYLTKFSRLVRLILQNSQSALIPLESELESLQLYLELEAVRFDHHFEFKISVEKDLDVSILKVPPLIIQPYAENAIWHGLMHKEEKGHLEIEVTQEDNSLYFKITDDGIGRQKATELVSKSATKHKSMGLKITSDRIAMLHRLNGTESPVTINDLVHDDGSAAGTEVILSMPVIN